MLSGAQVMDRVCFLSFSKVKCKMEWVRDQLSHLQPKGEKLLYWNDFCWQ